MIKNNWTNMIQYLVIYITIIFRCHRDLGRSHDCSRSQRSNIITAFMNLSRISVNMLDSF